MTDKTVTLASIAKELEMSPKIARAKVRRGVLDDVTSVKAAPWVFPLKEKRKVVAALKKANGKDGA
jgi:hypothetical protein